MESCINQMNRRFYLLLLLSLPVCISASGCSLMRFSNQSADALIRAGQNAHKEGDLVTANELFGAAVELNELDPQSRMEYAQSLWKTGNRNEAIIQMQAAVKLSQVDIENWQILARMHMESGDLISALSAINIAIKVDPELMDSYDLRGQIHSRRGDYAEAIADYERVITGTSQNVEVSKAIAHLYLQTGHPKRALAILAPIHDQYAEDHVPIEILDVEAIAYRQLFRYGAEAESLRSAVTQQPRSIDLRLRLAQAFYDDGDQIRARQQATEVLSIDSSNAQAYSLLSNN